MRGMLSFYNTFGNIFIFMDPLSLIFSIVILILSVVIHEVSHGYAADSLGDPTARLQGRLTLNPIKHLDLFGSIIVPALTAGIGGFIFGWAKPVPYNPYNISHKYGDALVAGAGPLSNFILALIFGLALRFIPLSPDIQGILSIIVLINLILAVFNLIPIPPLDGSKILFSLFPNTQELIQRMERYGFVLVLIFILFLWQLIVPIIFWLFTIITGGAPGGVL